MSDVRWNSVYGRNAGKDMLKGSFNRVWPLWCLAVVVFGRPPNRWRRWSMVEVEKRSGRKLAQPIDSRVVQLACTTGIGMTGGSLDSGPSSSATSQLGDEQEKANELGT
jgi:hypothetical protein